MPIDVRESKASATGTEVDDGARLFPSVESAISDFEANVTFTSIDFIETEKLSTQRVVIIIGYTS